MSKIDFNVNFTDDLLVDTEGTSDGTQCKYYSGGYWYKTNNEGEEDLVEYLVSKLLTFSDLPKDSYVIYERGILNGKKACRSKSFLSPEETFTTLERMHQNIVGTPLHKAIVGKELEESIQYVLDFVKYAADGLDLTDYFSKVFTADYITLNEDRHFHNLGIIMLADGRYKPAPIFDNGKSLLNANSSIKHGASIAENVKRVSARPFSGSHKKTFEYFGQGFRLDREGAIKWLKTEEESLYRDVLLYQLENVKLKP